MRILSATEADLPEIAALAEVVWRRHYPGIISGEQIEYMLKRMYDLDLMRQELDSGVCYDRLLVGDSLVAFASYGPVGPRELKLYKLYVHPDSQRRGLGSCLLRHVEDVSRSRGFESLCLTVNKANENAIAVYRKNGFILREPVVVEIGGGFVMDDYVMAKRL